MSMLQEFKTFISRGNVVDLAVGVIIGAAFGAIVTSLVTDIITPPLGYVLSGVKFDEIVTMLRAADADGKGAVTINWGKFLQAIINFLIVAFCIFLVVRLINKLKRPEPPAAPAGPTRDQELLIEIRDALRKQ